ncbi:hypothetical protein [Nocardiopsis sp. LOL_012]|uniref:hypothetical protein n=1 Tax=Nocardiopsis sp. LOL_012 TaxID=3345409 RepID=UPI003A8C32B2
MTPLTTRLVTAMYGQELAQEMSRYEVRFLRQPLEWLRPAEGVFVTGTTTDSTPPNPDVVVSAACVDHSEADPRRLAATVLADLVHSATVARLLDRPLLFFIGIGEEIRVVPGGHELASAWHEVARHAECLFDQLNTPVGSRLVHTDGAALWKAVSTTVEIDRSDLPNDRLDGLYHLLDGSAFPRGTPYTYFYDYYRANVAHYRRPVVEHVMGPCPDGVLVIENVQQVKAVAEARRLNGAWPTHHLVTLPAPGRSGGDRATRSAEGDRILLADLLQDPVKTLDGADPDVQVFWHSVIGLFERSCSEGSLS